MTDAIQQLREAAEAAFTLLSEIADANRCPLGRASQRIVLRGRAAIVAEGLLPAITAIIDSAAQITPPTIVDCARCGWATRISETVLVEVNKLHGPGTVSVTSRICLTCAAHEDDRSEREHVCEGPHCCDPGDTKS